jgi:hypothetical protein
MDLSLDAPSSQKLSNEVRVTGGDALPGKVSYAIIGLAAGHGHGQTTFSKTEFLHDLHPLVFFKEDILPHDAAIGHAVFHVLWNIIVAEKKDFQGKIIRFGAQPVFHIAQVDAAFSE